MSEERKRRLDSQEATNVREDQAAISHLATLLANGVDIVLGKSYPLGWDESRHGKTRKYIAAREEYLTAARKLLGWDRPAAAPEQDMKK
ncbi:MAG TPA: hypothetical protein VHD76_08310 [Bryobacteraceae bacterium]|jgi:hypothetical protein|nr:hypothetical protein [Bryobacteraceae bacterium]